MVPAGERDGQGREEERADRGSVPADERLGQHNVTDEYATVLGEQFQLGNESAFPQAEDEILFGAVRNLRGLERRPDEGVNRIVVGGADLTDGVHGCSGYVGDG